MMFSELETHPHVPAERAYLFGGKGDGSTEPEYLELVRALVRASKPTLIFESGTFDGAGTEALCSAVQANCHGRVISTEIDQKAIAMARSRLDASGLRSLATIVQGDAQSYLRGCGLMFDFLFLDSALEIRVAELRTAVDAGAVRSGSIVAFHDTSRLRIWDDKPDPRTATFWSELEAARELFAGLIEFPLSRGLVVGRLK